MDWQFCTKNKLVQHFKAHPLYVLFASVFAWVMSNFLTTPTVTAIAIVFLGYMALVILLEVWIKSKICHWIKSENHCYCIIYFGLLIICILTTLPFWNTLVYMCDRNNPYRQPLQIGKADIEVIVEPNGVINSGINRFGMGYISLFKERDAILAMEGWAGCEQTRNGQATYWVKPELDIKDKSINKPIYYLAEAQYAAIHFEKLPPKSKVISGEVIFTFNSSVRIEILIPPQTMEGDSIIIPEIQKYFKREN
jgi:hypothetical protein